MERKAIARLRFQWPRGWPEGELRCGKGDRRGSAGMGMSLRVIPKENGKIETDTSRSSRASGELGVHPCCLFSPDLSSFSGVLVPGGGRRSKSSRSSLSAE